MSSKLNFREWVFRQHEKAGNKYAGYLPYRFHLELCEKVLDEFKELLPSYMVFSVRQGVLGHDLLEETNLSYNDIWKALVDSGSDPGSRILNEIVAMEIIYACQNNKGRNRDERADASYYEGIRTTPYGIFAKLCDRIANVRFGKLMGSSQFNMYKSENNHFLTSLGFLKNNQGKWIAILKKEEAYLPMVEHLTDLLA